MMKDKQGSGKSIGWVKESDLEPVQTGFRFSVSVALLDSHLSFQDMAFMRGRGFYT